MREAGGGARERQTPQIRVTISAAPIAIGQFFVSAATAKAETDVDDFSPQGGVNTVESRTQTFHKRPILKMSNRSPTYHNVMKSCCYYYCCSYYC